MCRVCQHWPAVEVDHIQPDDNHDESNLQCICARCHAIKSAREGGRASAARRSSARRPDEPHPGLR
nr:HNH endonuclease signature motif containing protein [Lentzea sp. HUAS12]